MRKTLICIFYMLSCMAYGQQSAVSNAINSYLSNYKYDGFEENARVEKVVISDQEESLSIFISEPFGTQQFSEEKIDTIYSEIKKLLPAKYKKHHILLFCNNYPIEELCIGGTKKSDIPRSWEDIHNKGTDWITRLDMPFSITKGLQHRHLCVNASHGLFYDINKHKWLWQRPYLFCTTEDLLTQTIVVPYLIPMLENAGAIVYTTRERDWQSASAIVDNDTPTQEGHYQETNGIYTWEQVDSGFAAYKSFYVDEENPFISGTYKKVATQTRRNTTSSAIWSPHLEKNGKYAVYVSYATLPTSVDDATYTIRHRGINTHVKVNQQMGGGTWVYIGTYDFEANNPQDNHVILSNRSNHKGHITADAVRFGGGMGNIARGDSLLTSKFPRFFEGARYYAEWSGMPTSVYGNKQFTNDYSEDINTRTLMTNHLARGSVFLPGDSGLNVPIETCIGIHSDAGFRLTPEIIGTLAICTTYHNDGVFSTGISRLVSRDLCDITLSEIQRDVTAYYGTWNTRQIYDRNYSESRNPEMPSVIIETLSHQNFYDLCFMHDPAFKFILARAIYKAILRFTYRMHNEKNPIVAPLPIHAPSAVIKDKTIHLNWKTTTDNLEPTAKATGFIVYHAKGNQDFDNGTYTDNEEFIIENASENTLHRFFITAVNAGGESMKSTEICCYIASDSKYNILLVDAFSRLAGPQPIDNDTIQGFDLKHEPGSPIGAMPGYCGKQIDWKKSRAGHEGPGALGYSGQELEGMLIAGNTQNWSTQHARDIIQSSNGKITLNSCTSEAIQDLDVNSNNFKIMDLIGGLQKADGYSLYQERLFTSQLIQALAGYVRSGGRVVASGAFIGSDMQEESDRIITRSLLKYEYSNNLYTDSTLLLSGIGQEWNLYTFFNEEKYCVASVDCLVPISPAFCAAIYQPDALSAAVAYNGADYKTISFGFPIESVRSLKVRLELWKGILSFLAQ